MKATGKSRWLRDKLDKEKQGARVGGMPSASRAERLLMLVAEAVIELLARQEGGSDG